MSDRYLDFASSRVGARLASALGLPRPLPLRREAGRAPRAVFVGGGHEAALLDRLGIVRAGEDGPVDALLFDATAILTVGETAAVYDFFHANLPRVAEHGRILLLATPPEDASDAEAAAVQRGLEGFVRALAKEVRRAITVQILYVARGGEDALGSTLAFFLSDASAFVTGQPIRIGAPVASAGKSPRTVVVTGASRGIGAAIARSFADAETRLVLVDVPAMADDLVRLADDLGGAAVTLDVTAPDAPERLVADAGARGGYDVVVHNAGITRDRTLARMDAARWNQVMAVNLHAPIAITRALLAADAIPTGGRIVAVASLSGIAGNAGQTNYALSKAGVIGWIERLATEIGPRGITANAVAPGFIETQMTAAIPFAIREAGRRMSSLGQGGQPEDVASTIHWLADPGSGGITGETVRVCGQSLLGA